MHDIAAIRRDRDAWVAALARRPAYAESAGALADDILARDKELRDLVTRLQAAQARRNEASKLIGQAKAKKDESQASALLAEVAGLKEEIQQGEARERELQEALRETLAGIDNLPAPDVPEGGGEDDNVEVTVRAFGSAPNVPSPREHYELGEQLGMMDFERAAKVSGSRFVYLTAGLARLERAIANFMLDLHTGEFGYTEVQPPLLVLDPAMYGTGQLPKFEDDLFFSTTFPTMSRQAWTLAEQEAAARRVVRRLVPHMPEHEVGNVFGTVLVAVHQDLSGEIEDSTHSQTGLRFKVSVAKQMLVEELKKISTDKRAWLVPTAEVSLTNYVREEILDEDSLPRRYTAWTPCFRAEAGAAGKDTRGMIRMHQFSKVELVSIATPEKSDEEHERMTDCAQAVLKRLNLHHRVMTLCAGDMGFSAKKTYDIEVWLPGQGRFREISSCSNCGDFQARRMNARYRPKGEKGTRFVHTLNGSGLAVGRTLIAIMENYQNPDGSIAVPDVLKPYMGGLEKIAKQ
ncbi:MAG TPA: serine--tRNA ligase [Rhizomicrobium sp.]|nr:serine--tRNA ligase [Rhizomicrobium sp.]